MTQPLASLASHQFDVKYAYVVPGKCRLAWVPDTRATLKLQLILSAGGCFARSPRHGTSWMRWTQSAWTGSYMRLMSSNASSSQGSTLCSAEAAAQHCAPWIDRFSDTSAAAFSCVLHVLLLRPHLRQRVPSQRDLTLDSSQALALDSSGFAFHNVAREATPVLALVSKFEKRSPSQGAPTRHAWFGPSSKVVTCILTIFAFVRYRSRIKLRA